MTDKLIYYKRDHQGVEKNRLSEIEGGDNIRIMYSNGTFDTANNIKNITRYLNHLQRKGLHGRCDVYDKQNGLYRFRTNF